MKVIGLTGGIGSGKSTVAKMFSELGVPVYDSDDQAKKLMTSSKELQEQIVGFLGEEAYLNGTLNRPYIAEKVFDNPNMLQQLNAIVHPAVRKHFQDWKLEQESPYVIQETALIFENNMEDYYDAIILVTAPLNLRLERVMARDGLGIDDVMQRVKNQMGDELKREKSDFVVENIDLDKTLQKVKQTHETLVKLAD